MNFGKLNQQIVIQKYTESRTGSGDVVKSWADYVTTYAKIEYKTGGEKNEADQLQGFSVVEFTVRYCAALTANEMMRVSYNSEYFGIEFVNEIEIKKYQKLITRRKTIWQEQ